MVLVHRLDANMMRRLLFQRSTRRLKLVGFWLFLIQLGIFLYLFLVPGEMKFYPVKEVTVVKP